MRGTLLSTLVTMLKAELGYSLDSSATGKDAALKQRLATKQKWLAGEWDWQFLSRRWEVSCTASTRYFSIPTTDTRSIASTINFERPVEVFTNFSSQWQPLDYGIGIEQLNAIDSDTPTTSDPIQRWQFATNTYEASNADQFEVWPIPSTTQTVRFVGQRAVQALSSDSDHADLDDLLLVLFVAADLVPEEERTLCVSKAQARLRRVLGGYSQKPRRVLFGGLNEDVEKEPKKVVAVAAA